MKRIVKNLLLSVVFILIQTTVLRLVALEGIVPDLLAIWIVYIAVTEGQLSATLWGFGIGLTFDLASGGFIGLSALTKTILGFFAGYFYGENKIQMTLSSYRFPLIVLIVSVIHNTVYFALYTRGTEIGLVRSIAEIGFATSLYTATVSLLPMFTFSRRRAI